MDEDIASQIAALAGEAQLTVGAAESLTAGAVASALGAAPGASEWFLGGIVAYATNVKQHVLGVEPGPVVSGPCAAQMATGARNLLGADLVVSTTGVGGPDRQEGQPVGTVFIAVDARGAVRTFEHHFDGDAADIVAQTVAAALRALRSMLPDAEPERVVSSQPTLPAA